MIKILLNSLFLLMITTPAALSQVKMKKIISFPKEMGETSGLVLYKGKYLITHNDGGNKKDLFVVNLKGELIKKIEVENAKNKDWEDLAQDDQGRLFVGDFGNNANKREKCQIYILPKSFLDKKKVEAKKITFWYEDQKKFPPKKSKFNYDCEAFFWKDGQLFLFTKCRTKPYTGESRIYVLPAKAGKYPAKYIGSVFLGKTGWRFTSVTGADYDAKTNTLALLTYSKLFVISGFNKNEFWNGHIKAYSLPVVKQREAICFSGKNKLFMTDELKKGLGGGNLYQIQLK